MPGLLDLPAEPRIRIYEYALPRHNTKLWFTGMRGSKRGSNFTATITPKLAQVSEQIRNESLPIFRSRTFFYLRETGEDLEDAIDDIWPQLLRKLLHSDLEHANFVLCQMLKVG